MSNHEQLINSISERYGRLIDEIKEFSSLNNIKMPKVIAVSKTRSIEEILAAWDVGIREFGENYAKELALKVEKLPKANWHFIGHLQRKNVKYVVSSVNLIHTVDTIKLANRLKRLGYKNNILIQVNISGEVSKSGVEFKEDKLKILVDSIKDIKLNLVGLMGMSDPNWEPSKTYKIYKSLKSMASNLELDEVSMGMSADWQEAVKAGSTFVRIGTAIFGKRTI